MIYSSQRAQAIQKKDITYLAAGIHDNVVLESIRVDKSLNGNNFIEFKFVAKDGKFMTHTEWEPSKSDNMSMKICKENVIISLQELTRFLNVIIQILKIESLMAKALRNLLLG